MSGRGGYQAPANPATVSGIGRHSRRTDGGPSDQKRFDIPTGDGDWGDNKELSTLQSDAPMGSTPLAPSAPAPQAGTAPTPFGAPTERPDEPVTTPGDFGPGTDTVAAATRAAYVANPTSAFLRALVTRLEQQGR